MTADKPSKELARLSSHHLSEHRRLIVVRSLAAGLAGMTPLPVLDDWLAAVIRRGTLRRIAEARQVDVTPEALRAVADGKSQPPTWKSLASAGLVPLLVKRSFKKAMILFAAARRADEVMQSFAVATLFDHYCARVHVGAGLDEGGGKVLRAQMDAALSASRGRTVSRLFRRGLAAAGRAALRAPFEVLEIASSGVLSRLRGRANEGEAEAEAVEVVEGAVASAVDEKSFLGKVASAVDVGVSTVGQEYVSQLVGAFEAQKRAAGS